VGADYLVDDNLLIKASIENVTNLDFERPYGYKQPERTFSISLKYLF
jgi:outer membrane cobalamin receptor